MSSNSSSVQEFFKYFPRRFYYADKKFLKTFLSYLYILSNLRTSRILYLSELFIYGVGYKFEKINSRVLKISLGYSHYIYYLFPSDTGFLILKKYLAVFGYNQIIVGHMARQLRSFRAPSIYTSKGIRYVNEIINRKEGKKRQQR